jgi:hypothetical protein
MQTHTLARSSKWPHEFTSYQQRNYIILIWKIHRHTQVIAKECLLFPSQWNCYQLLREWQVSGTPETMAYHETLRKECFCKGSMRDNTVHLSFMELKTKVRATQGWSSSDFGNEPNFYKSMMANWTINFTHTQTHTYTNWWDSNNYLVNEFLFSIYGIAMLSKARSHWTPDTLVDSIYFHSVNDRFWFKESAECLSSRYTQWVWNSL